MSALLMEKQKKIEIQFRSLPLSEFQLKKLQPLQLIAERYKWKSMLRDRIILGHLKPIAPIEFAKVILTRHSCKAPIMQSLVASFKGIVDGLIEYGIIKHNAVIEYRTAICGKHDIHIDIEVLYCEI